MPLRFEPKNIVALSRLPSGNHYVNVEPQVRKHEMLTDMSLPLCPVPTT